MSQAAKIDGLIQVNKTCDKFKDGFITFTKISLGTHRLFMGINTYIDVFGVGAYESILVVP